MNNWKTSLAAILYPLGKALQNYTTGPHWFYFLGQALEVTSVAFLGLVAKDFNKTGVK